MVKIIHNILNDAELIYLNNFCKAINEAALTQPAPGRSSYKRTSISLEKDTIEKILNIVKINYDIKCKHTASWVNVVDNKGNKDDYFHYDVSDFSIIIYLNDDFTGGELEYQNSNIKPEIKKFTPVKNSAVLMSKNVLHRVLPVLDGKRYSMVNFFDFDTNFIKEKSLI